MKKKTTRRGLRQMEVLDKIEEIARRDGYVPGPSEVARAMQADGEDVSPSYCRHAFVRLANLGYLGQPHGVGYRLVKLRDGTRVQLVLEELTEEPTEEMDP